MRRRGFMASALGMVGLGYLVSEPLPDVVTVATDPLIESLKVHHLHPGDRLVIRCPGRMPYEQYLRIKEAMQEWAPGVPCIVLTEGMELEAVRGLPNTEPVL